MTPSAPACYCLARLFSDLPVNGEAAAVEGPFRPVIDHLAGLPFESRAPAWDVFCLAPGLDREALTRRLAEIDPSGPPPEPQCRRAAHLGHLGATDSSRRFVWPGWIVRGHFNLLSSDPKIGKTHLMLDLARRLWFGLAMPDGQPPVFPIETSTLWVCGDRHQDELRERAHAFGLPDEAVRLNALEEDAWGGWNLDDPANVALFHELILVERPGLAIIDTVWRATRRQLRREEEVNALLDPIVTTAQQTDTAIVGLMHLSKDGETLGRRMEGLARAVMKLTKPDPDGQPDRRKLQVIGNFKEPPALGVTMGSAGCEYDFTPPSEPAPAKAGRPPAECEKAKTLIVEALTRQNDQKGVKLVDDLVAKGESKGTVYNARDALVASGRLIVDATVKPQVWHLVQEESEMVSIPISDLF